MPHNTPLVLRLWLSRTNWWLVPVASLKAFWLMLSKKKTACLSEHLGFGQQDMGNSEWGDMHGSVQA